MTRAAALLAACASCWATVAPAQVVAHRGDAASRLLMHTLNVPYAAEVTVVIRAACSGCSWGIEGREAAAVKISVDGRYSQHLLLSRGEDPSDYHIALGAFEPGRHALRIDLDPDLSAPHVGSVSVSVVSVEASVGTQTETPDFTALSRAPILYARRNTVGRFTDLPILMWYEIVATPRGRQFRYSVIFTNEDGGTPTDRLMATWGRTTDIEFVYSVELDPDGATIAEEYQGAGHEVPKFAGRHEGRHPLLWVATDNNMVSDAGTTTIRYRLAPERFDLSDVSREAVMDARPWTYRLAAEETAREGKIQNDAAPGSGKIPDPRSFVIIEACSELENAALAFSVHVKDAGGGARWYDADRGLPDFRIARTGCFRGAVSLPPESGRPDAIRFRAFRRLRQAGGEQTRVAVNLTHVNKVFMLGPGYAPRDSMFTWIGWLPLPIDGEWRELAF